MYLFEPNNKLYVLHGDNCFKTRSMATIIDDFIQKCAYHSSFNFLRQKQIMHMCVPWTMI